ncbi:MAG: hypothetical protein ACOX9R_02740 [Armatimonadota bacterium]|jgi:uncharacterized coiled-coil protein SlyX
MSNEERNDEMVDETSDAEDIEATDDIEDTEATEEPYSYTSSESRRSGGSSAGIWVIIILVIVALIGVGWYQWNQTQRQQAEQARVEREQTRERQMQTVVAGLPEAESALAAGNIDVMVDRLKEMDEKMAIIAAAANQAGDVEAAQRITAQRKTVQNAIEELAPVYEEIQAKRAELRALEDKLKSTAQSSLESVRGTFGEPPAEPGAEEPAVEEPVADEPASEDEAAEAEEPAEEASADDESADDAEQAPEEEDADEDAE